MTLASYPRLGPAWRWVVSLTGGRRLEKAGRSCAAGDFFFESGCPAHTKSTPLSSARHPFFQRLFAGRTRQAGRNLAAGGL